MQDSTKKQLSVYANDLWLSRNYGTHPEKDIIIDEAVTTAYLNLEVRYQTYAENSWTDEVLWWVGQGFSQNCSCDNCDDEDEKWFIREVQISREVHYQLDCLMQKIIDNYKKEIRKLCGW